MQTRSAVETHQSAKTHRRYHFCRITLQYFSHPLLFHLRPFHARTAAE